MKFCSSSFARGIIGRLGVVFALVLSTATVIADDESRLGSVSLFLDCSAYFFMAANAKSMGEFDSYYRSGEFAYNRALRLVEEPDALARFNAATAEINELIERNWNEFQRADDRYGVVCADLFRAATLPDQEP